MAAYNGGRFIRAQLDSFVDQTLQPQEVVVCDDGSTDDTAEIVADFARTAPFAVRFERNSERMGYSRNFERAILLCRGDIVFLSDQDDKWFKNKISTVAQRFSEDPHIQVIVNDQEMAGADLAPAGVTKLQNLRNIGKDSRSLIEGCCTAVRSSWARLALPLPRDNPDWIDSDLLSYDRWLNELASFLGVRSVVDEPLQLFRRHGANATNWIASEPRPVGNADLFATRVALVPVEDWQKRLGLLDAYVRWIQTNEQLLRRIGIGDCARALREIRHEQQSVDARIALTALSLHRRVPRIVALLSRGGYKYFHGWKSAARDLVRTR